MVPDGSTSILIIDGDDLGRRRTSDRLKTFSSDFEVFEATDGRSALVRCQTRVFDCIVLELNLPDITGFEVLHRLIPDPRHPAVPVIVLTVFSSQCLMMETIMKGAQDWLTKSEASSEQLGSAITKAMASVNARLMPQAQPTNGISLASLSSSTPTTAA